MTRWFINAIINNRGRLGDFFEKLEKSPKRLKFISSFRSEHRVGQTTNRKEVVMAKKQQFITVSRVGIFSVVKIGDVKNVTSRRFANALKKVDLRDISLVVIISENYNPVPWAVNMVSHALGSPMMVAVDMRTKCIVTFASQETRWKVGNCITNPDPEWRALRGRHTHSAKS